MQAEKIFMIMYYKSIRHYDIEYICGCLHQKYKMEGIIYYRSDA